MVDIDILFVGALVIALNRGTRSVLMTMAVRMHEIAVSQNGTQHALDNRVCEHQSQGRVHFQDFIARIARRRENALASVTDVVVHLLGQPGLQDHKAFEGRYDRICSSDSRWGWLQSFMALGAWEV